MHGRGRPRLRHERTHPEGHFSRPLHPTCGAFVNEGPNTRLAYLQRVPAQVSAIVALNPEMRIGSEFYRAQGNGNETVTSRCVQTRFTRYVAQILEHEGYPANDHSHAGYYRKKLFERAWPAVEDIVRPSDELGQMVDAWQDRLPAVFAEAHEYSGRVDVEYPVPFGCSFTF